MPNLLPRSTRLHEISLNLLNQQVAKLTNKRAFSFAFIGDSWYGREPINGRILTQVLNGVAKKKPLYLLHGGDIVFSGSTENLTRFKNFIYDFMKRTGIPVFVVPGNHERNGTKGSLENYMKIIGPPNFKVNVPNVRVIGINNIGPVGTITNNDYTFYYGFSNDYGRRELNQLKANLRNAPKSVVLLMHVPPYAGEFRAKYPNNDPNHIQENGFFKGLNSFCQLVRSNPKIKKGLVSHIHNDNVVDTICGAQFVLSGRAGAEGKQPGSFYLFNVSNGTIGKPQRFRVPVVSSVKKR